MFSSTTIELSTSMPAASDSPPERHQVQIHLREVEAGEGGEDRDRDREATTTGLRHSSRTMSSTRKASSAP